MNKRTQPDKSIEDTGERMVPAYHKTHMVYGEHIARYSSVLDIVKNKVVLDVAAGSGYGSALLASVAASVTGIDINKEAIQYAKKNYGHKNINFIVGSATELPVNDESYDVVVSYETIEHIEDYKGFLREIKRVLRPDGLLILSTPNDLEFPTSNHFHIHEFEQHELEDEVKRFFKNTKTYLQGTWLYNAVLSQQQCEEEWDLKIRTLNTAPIAPIRATYFQMLCANRALHESIDPIGVLSEHWSERRMQENEASIRDHIEEQGRIIKHLENEVSNSTSENKRLQGELAEIKNSKAWKMIRGYQTTKDKINHKLPKNK